MRRFVVASAVSGVVCDRNDQPYLPAFTSLSLGRGQSISRGDARLSGSDDAVGIHNVDLVLMSHGWRYVDHA